MIRKNSLLERQGCKILLLVIVLYGLFLMPFVSAGLWDDRLVSYWNLNESYSSNKTIDIYRGIHNSSSWYGLNATEVMQGCKGIHELGYCAGMTTDVGNQYINITNSSDLQWNSTGVGTVSFWIYFTDPIINGVSIVNLPSEHQVNFQITGPFAELYQSDGTLTTTPDTTKNDIVTGRWYNIVHVANGTRSILYINGTFIANDSYDGTIARMAVDNELRLLLINGAGGVTGNFTVDEISLWNRSLNENEILNLWNDGNGLFYGELEPFAINNVNYNPTTTETASETFIINITYDNSIYSTVTSALIYNGTSYPTSLTGSGNNLLFTKTINIPSVPVTTTKQFHWEFALTNLTGGIKYINSSFYNQAIIKGGTITVNGTCPAGFSASLNYTFIGETNSTEMNASVNYYITYGQSGNMSSFIVNGSILDVTRFSICINNSQSSYYIGYGEFQYFSSGYSNRRNYIYTGTMITNSSSNTNKLYLLDSALSTSFSVVSKTTTLIPYNNHYLNLLRWYPETGAYKVVDMGKTDDKGNTLLNVKTETVDYRIGLYNNTGSLIKLINPIRMICQVQPCIYNLFVDTITTDITSFLNVDSSLTYDETTHIFTYVWSDTSGLNPTMNLTVYKDTGTGSTIICSSSSSGATGILTCDVTGYTGNLRAVTFRTASPQTIIKQLLITIRSSIIDTANGKTIGLLITGIIFVFFILVGLVSPPLAVILGIIGLVPALLIGSINLTIFLGIAVLGGIILHFLRRTT